MADSELTARAREVLAGSSATSSTSPAPSPSAPTSLGVVDRFLAAIAANMRSVEYRNAVHAEAERDAERAKLRAAVDSVRGRR